MAAKSIGTIILVIIGILLLPVVFGILGGIFGVIFGVFGAIFGVIGAIFGAIFGIFGWLFDGLFGWNDFHFGHFNFNLITIAIIVLLAAVLAKKRPR